MYAKASVTFTIDRLYTLERDHTDTHFGVRIVSKYPRKAPSREGF